MKKIIWLGLFLCSLNLNAANTSAHDPGIINKQRIEYWLNKRADTQQTTNKPTVESYLANTARLNPSQLKSVSTMKARLTAKQADKQLQYASAASPSNALNEVKVLAILIDFPDLKHDDNQLVDDDTDMYYENYTKEHYQQLLFNEGGFIGPNNETLSSVYDYYYDASGASLTFSGQVYGWVRADSNAKTYGERVGNTRDINAPALIQEAVEKATAQFDIDLTQYDLTDLDDIDGDGIINEPNGIIDHVMVFHSSIGEESGGGYLGVDAIWSHRYYVFDENSEPVSIAGSSVKLSGYTINPIDASIGVVAHEFGHDLGLADEYDLQSNTVGEPVSSWSIMSTGSWAGGPRGSQPVMFSAQALEYLQNRYQGNWVNQLNLTMEEVNSQPQQSLVYTSSLSQQQSQIKVTLAQQLEKFKTPVEGDFQFYSGTGNNLTHALTNRDLT
ncbi:immune inhibitor A domain-containing protein [Pseudoalteromonas sp. 2CM28B]|uniref:immune inhibitor A domain-containing protein n=1 Tax=Pseudoalteromonas sp. 2CM28B TaxID=2929851 RepID=UPI0035AE7D94